MGKKATEERKEALQGLIRLDGYFERNIKNHPLFEPESNCSKRILAIISKNNLENEDLNEIVRIFNETGKVEHYGGSGWLDFALHLRWYLKSFGLNVELVSWQKIVIK